MKEFQDSRQSKINFRKLFFIATIMSLVTILGPGFSPAAPVPYTGLGWQATLDRDERALTYSFDHTGGYALTIEGSAEHTTALDTQFDAIIPAWKNILETALTSWGATANIKFTEVTDSGLDLGVAGAAGNIRFSTHSMDFALAHAFLPMKTGLTEEGLARSYFGDVHFSTDWPWDADLFQRVVTHELGHALGLGHNLDPYSIMQPFANYIKEPGITAHDESDIRALYFPMNQAAEVYTETTLTNHRDWIAIMDGSEENRKTLAVSGHIDTEAEQKTAIKGEGVSLSIENYSFDWVDLTILDQGQITTKGDNAYGMAVGDYNIIAMNGSVETSGLSSDGIAVLGSANLINTGSGSLITTHGNGANGLYMGGDRAAEKNYAFLGGQIRTTGAGSAGVYMDVDDAVLSLNGKIITQGELGYGIFSYINNARIDISASGSISTSGINAIGVYNLGTNSTFMNMGKITTLGEMSQAIILRLGNNTLIHGGSIETSGLNAFGIWARNSNNIVDLSGDILSRQAEAIRMGFAMDSANDFILTADTGNILLIHGSPEISGNITNGGADNGATVYFGVKLDETSASGLTAAATDLVYNDNFSGRQWRGEVFAGSVRLNGSLNTFSNLTIHSGATLGGNTTFAGNLVNDGTVAPGNSIGTITITGDYLQESGSTLAMEIGGSASDLLEVGGDATFLSGSFLAVESITPVLSGNLALLSTGGTLNGTPQLYLDDSALLHYSLLTDSQAMTLNVDRTAYRDVAANNNQQQFGAVLDRLLPDATGDLAGVLLEIDSLQEIAEVQQAFDALVPDKYAALPDAAFIAMRGFLGSLPVEDSGPKNGKNWKSHAQLLALQTDRDGDDGLDGYQIDSKGLVIGADRYFDGYRLGGALSYQNMQIDHDESNSRDDLDVFLASIEGKSYRDGRYLQGILGYGHLWGDSRRDIQAFGFSRQATSDSQTDILFVGMEVGLDTKISTLTLTPFAGLDYSACFWGDFSEKGAVSMNMTIDDTTADSLRSNLGLAVAVPTELPGGFRLDTRLRLTWSHEFADTEYTYQAQMAGENFDVHGRELGEDIFVGGLGAEAHLTKNLFVRAGVSYEVRNDNDSFSVQGGLMYEF